MLEYHSRLVMVLSIKAAYGLLTWRKKSANLPIEIFKLNQCPEPYCLDKRALISLKTLTEKLDWRNG
jgi:hypothetical protein